MCVEGCHKAVQKAIARREFIETAAGVVAGATLGANVIEDATAAPRNFTKAIDLTHTLNKEFPTYGGTENYVELEKIYTIEHDGYLMYKWHITEHVGTHLDAPAHFSPEGNSCEEIDVETLVTPLAVINVKTQAALNSDYQVSIADIEAWENVHGRLPDHCCVAMNSGWSDHLGTDKFRNEDSQGSLHFPGFSIEAAEFLRDKRNVNGIAVDTLSLDYGPSIDFSVHVAWLLSNRWGLEAVANLDDVPPIGATLVVGSPKIENATGGPARLIALI
ncbi:MAG: cyclase [Alphaproteobacteria bacterium]|nr:MAG: cyclase [Alphaproteobacteria bacterium]